MTATLLLALAVGLSACGRNGPPDAPPASLSGPPPADLQVDAQGRTVAPAGQKKRIFLDSLLD
jgi:predicted small lipoprotein YifL